MLKLPGLIDPHVHMREPGAVHKEDWESGTKAGLAGGFTTLLAMPNTEPAITSGSALQLVEKTANQKAYTDFGHFMGAGPVNAEEVSRLATRAVGLKMYLDQTYGSLRLDDFSIWQEHFLRWPGKSPIAVHAEGRSLPAVLMMSLLYDKPVHICHVARRKEILLIRFAKEKGVRVTCEATPHHLFLTENDIQPALKGKWEVRPRLASPEDREALWTNLRVIDCFATDHAPHTLIEKESDEPPPGFPGLETALLLFSEAIKEGRLSFAELIEKMHTNPARIFNLPDQKNTWIEFDPEPIREITARDMFTRCGWTPFEGWQVHGQLTRVVLHGETVFENGEISGKPGFGRNVKLTN